MGVTYTLQCLKTAEHSAPVPVLLHFERLAERRLVNCYFWLVRGGGKTILIDTGMGGEHPFPQESYRRAASAFPVGEGMDTVSRLREHGVAPEQVDLVILTHLHMDHCANAPLFANARIAINRRGWANALEPKHPVLAPYPPEVIAYLRDRMSAQLLLLDDEAEVLPGISVFRTGGHTICSQAVKVQTAQGAAVVSGDVCFLYENLERNHPIGLASNLEECVSALARIRREADIVLPGHDPEILVRHPGGLVGQAENREE